MLVYYCGAYNRQDVLASAPIELGEADTKRVFAGIVDDGSFLGVKFAPGWSLQLYQQKDGTVHAEILDSGALRTRYCTVNEPLAELLIEAAFRREDFEQKIAFSRVVWRNDILNQPNKSVQRMPLRGIAD
jgi:hypothetical protein